MKIGENITEKIIIEICNIPSGSDDLLPGRIYVNEEVIPVRLIINLSEKNTRWR